MSHLDPTYLRYIYDSLVNGSIHTENAAELPDGLIDLYEEVVDGCALGSQRLSFTKTKTLNKEKSC